MDGRAEIAAALSLRQIMRTLDVVLPEAGPWLALSYPLYRFVGQLSPEQRSIAQSDAGLPLTSLPPWQQAESAADFRSRLRNVSADQLENAVVRLDLHYRPQNYRQAVVHLSVGTGSSTLVEASG